MADVRCKCEHVVPSSLHHNINWTCGYCESVLFNLCQPAAVRFQITHWLLASQNKDRSGSNKFWTYWFCFGSHAVSLEMEQESFLVKTQIPKCHVIESSTISIKYWLNSLSSWVGISPIQTIDWQWQFRYNVINTLGGHDFLKVF